MAKQHRSAIELTDEQVEFVRAFRDGENMIGNAGAGTGKTSTERQMAATVADEKGMYTAYNRAIVDDGKGSFPRNVQCGTMHSFAFRAIGYKYKKRLDEGKRMRMKEIARILGIRDYFVDQHAPVRIRFSPDQIARTVSDTVKRFCGSTDMEPGSQHVPGDTRLSAIGFTAYRELVTAFAKRYWNDILSENGRLKFEHDHYLKMWAMSEPVLPVDFVLYDEAQDADRCQMQIVMLQAKHGKQVVMVGDEAQAIYAWRGAVDAMKQFDADVRLTLSQSFRFGPAIADEANKWLTLLDGPLRLKGFDKCDSKLESLPGNEPGINSPDAILCRTNATCMAEAFRALEDGLSFAFVGDMQRQIDWFADGALALQQNIPTSHPDLAGFENWADVQSYAQEPEGSDLKVLVNLIDAHGVAKIKQIATEAVDEKLADVTISTAHKSKGREWDKVRIADDFREPEADPDTGVKELAHGEGCLNYVAVTRAKKVLDRGGLAWVDAWIQEREDAEASTQA